MVAVNRTLLQAEKETLKTLVGARLACIEAALAAPPRRCLEYGAPAYGSRLRGRELPARISACQR